jgi:hypothetical protein
MERKLNFGEGISAVFVEVASWQAEPIPRNLRNTILGLSVGAILEEISL